MPVINGTASAEELVGSNDADILNGNGGSDEYRGQGGDDVYNGGSGNDRFYNSPGADTAYGGPGNDHFYYLLADGVATDRESFHGGTGINTVHVDATAMTGGFFTLDARPGWIGRGATSTGFDFRDVSVFDIETGAANDLIFTLDGDDRISTGAGRDRIKAGGGNDVLDGGDGNDRLIGGAGDDIFTGGAGRDLLVGGGGADTFVYALAGDSRTTRPDRDVIRGFRSGDDRIDLRAMDAVDGGGDDSFVYIGSARFSGTAGELRVAAEGRQVIVSGDVDGDGAADFAIALTGGPAVDVSDFLL